MGDKDLLDTAIYMFCRNKCEPDQVEHQVLKATIKEEEDYASGIRSTVESLEVTCYSLTVPNSVIVVIILVVSKVAIIVV